MEAELSDFIEKYRAKQVARLHTMRTFSSSWKVWEPQIQALTSNLSNASEIYHLGDHLSEIFRSTGGEGRDQSSLSGGGAAWEALICWYLNLVFTGTRAIAFKQSKAMVPSSLFDAATVTYGNRQTNTESDISVIVLPEGISLPTGKHSDFEIFTSLVNQKFSQVTLGIIQCKTNWNDNAQIPMLWDMVYKGNYSKDSGVTVGKHGYSIKHLNFSYSFVVVPSQKSEIKAGSTPAIRVNSLSGGNYWGQPSKQGVALSVSEIFTRNFGSAFENNVQDTIRAAVAKKIGPYVTHPA